MESTTLSAQDIKSLEQTRQRLSQLKNSLGAFQQGILQSDTLPPWSSVQTFSNVISQNLASVSETLNTHHELFASVSAYPLPEFPGRDQENVITQILRKKPEPHVEDWVFEGRKIAMEAAGQDGSVDAKDLEIREIWSWAGYAANEQARKHAWGGNYTLEEREMGIENVVTGLKRKLKDDDNSDDDDDDEDAVEDVPGDEMEIVGVHRKMTGDGVEFELASAREHKAPEAMSTALPLNDIFRFMTKGTAPA